jgi:hypothetical protein
MPDLHILIKTYACPSCSYTQDFDPRDEAQMRATFPELRYAGLPAGDCPACYAGENPDRTRRASAMELLEGPSVADLLNQKTIASDGTLAETRVTETDESGRPILEQVDERYEARVHPQTGAITSELVPVLEVKTRELTEKELKDLQQQRDRSLDDVAEVAVKEL